jgi:hypothetical protein
MINFYFKIKALPFMEVRQVLSSSMKKRQTLETAKQTSMIRSLFERLLTLRFFLEQSDKVLILINR